MRVKPYDFPLQIVLDIIFSGYNVSPNTIPFYVV